MTEIESTVSKENNLWENDIKNAKQEILSQNQTILTKQRLNMQKKNALEKQIQNIKNQIKEIENENKTLGDMQLDFHNYANNFSKNHTKFNQSSQSVINHSKLQWEKWNGDFSCFPAFFFGFVFCAKSH